MKKITLVAICAAFVAASAHGAENLVINGDFSDSENPLKGWMYDYQWLKNENYMKNHERVGVVPTEAGRRSVCKLAGQKGYSEVKLESNPIKFEQNYQYTCTMDIKGGTTHVYFAGYKWKPGIRPHEDPADGELRLLYKSKLQKVSARNWDRITFSIPGVSASPLSLKHLKYVRFIRVYLVTIGGEKDTFIDNVVVTRKPYDYSKHMKR